jgi:transcriptional regulator with XRE-family HTH domain
MSPKKRLEYERLLAQERLILEATEAIVALLEETGVSRQELAKRLGKSKSFVSQILSGERNMTLRTLADVGYALGHPFSMSADLAPSDAAGLRAVFAAFSGEAANPMQIPANVVRDRQRAAGEIQVDPHEFSLAA